MVTRAEIVHGGWYSPDSTVLFCDLPIGALFTGSLFYCDETRLRQKVDEDRWARLNLDKTAEGSDVVRYGFEGRSSSMHYWQCEWIPTYNGDPGPDFMRRLLDTTCVPVVGCPT